MHYDVYGSGSPIVFIHGSFASTSTWKKMIATLSREHLCIAIKLPGHCGTPDPDDFAAPSMEPEFSVIEDAIGQLTNEPVHLVGHSFGGVVALALTMKGSVTLRHLTLFEPVAVAVLAESGEEKAHLALNQFVSDYRDAVTNNKPYACGKVIDFWGGAGSFDSMPEALRDGMVPFTANNIRHWDLCQSCVRPMSDYQSLATPTTVVCGGNSNPIAQTIAKQLHAHIPNSTLTFIEGASHFMVTTHAKACLAAMQCR
ncbi:alpha/beta hydrolase [Photobacterium frigidiphilum]|uniref:Alpha/beta hydrolase n=1 Tax=Photobacterium frigidiphilum TaxID=264736 RepID=A0A2T3JNA4_9GAMM|nr:alpha/beta hydrolase [Photobacterium frigidiphilum]PSU50525.1 alpha/beta hydrolase [Photobacterium frigidiphilum]